MSTRSVLLLAFVVAIGAALLALFVGAGWRRFWWWRRYHSYVAGKQPARDADGGHRTGAMATAVPVPPSARTGNGSNGATADDGSVTIVTPPERRRA